MKPTTGVALGLLFARVLFGETAQISGLITDPSASVVPGAEVTLRNDQTGGLRRTRSNSAGLFSFPSLTPGEYRITARAPNFETVVREGIRLPVGGNARVDIMLPLGDNRTTVTVSSSAQYMNTDDASVGTVIDRKLIERLPLNGRGLQALIELTPGVVQVPVTPFIQGQFSVNGQLQNTNWYTVDGASINFGTSASNDYLYSPGFGQNNGSLGSGHLPALSSLGTFSNLVSPEALQEFRIQTSTFSPEYGRSPGAQVDLVSRSGTNRLRGSLFEYIRNDATDANNWFYNAYGFQYSPRKGLRYHDFGGVVGGPLNIPRLYRGTDRTFFFFSYEGTHLKRRKFSERLVVPSLEMREAAPPSMRMLLDMAPLPSRAVAAAPYPGWRWHIADRWRRDAQQNTSLRIDHAFSDVVTMFGRYTEAPSEAHDFMFASTALFRLPARTGTIGVTHLLSPRLVNDVRVNASRQEATQTSDVDTAAGARRPLESMMFPAGLSAQDSAFFTVLDWKVIAFLGVFSRSSGTQVQLADTLSWNRGLHRIRVGADYRRYTSWNSLPRAKVTSSYTPIVDSSGVYTRTADQFWVQKSLGDVLWEIPNFAAFVQDTWRPFQRLSLTYGLRWDVNPGPRYLRGRPLAYAQSADWQTATVPGLITAGHRFYPTAYTNVAPRLGLAFLLSNRPGGELVLRAGSGLFYDTAQNGFNIASRQATERTLYYGVPIGEFSAGEPRNGIPATSDYPYPPKAIAAAPGYSMPRSWQWNIAIEKALHNQSVSASYVGSNSRKLGGTIPNFFDEVTGTYVDLISSLYASSYNALQVQFSRRSPGRLQTLVSWTWSHALDNLVPYNSLSQARKPELNKGPSDFDIRHNLAGAFLLDVPAPRSGLPATLLRNWTADVIFFARSSLPTDVLSSDTEEYPRRPDIVPGKRPVLHSPVYPGGKALNPEAFAQPDDMAEQGTLGRNVFRLFGAWQVDLAARRTVNLGEHVSMEFKAEAFNLLNHPQFASPAASSAYPQVALMNSGRIIGRSNQTRGSSLSRSGAIGELNPVFQSGQPRSIQFAVRLAFGR